MKLRTMWKRIPARWQRRLIGFAVGVPIGVALQLALLYASGAL